MLGPFLGDRFLSTWLFLTLLSLTSLLHGQTNSTKTVSSALPLPEAVTRSVRVSVSVNLVLVPVTVIDSLHRPVLGLGKQNFELIEGQQEQQIRYFSQEDEPISVALLLDISGSMANRIGVLREAVHQFFIHANPLDDYTVVTVSSRPEVLIRATRSIEDVRAILEIVKPAGWTALLDSIRLAAMTLKHARYERRVILIVSDGLDNVSRHRLSDVASFIEESNIDVYAIGVKDEASPLARLLEERIDKKLLMRITDVTGGNTVVVEHSEDLPQAAAKISRSMRNEYLLGYCPTDGGHTRMWRKIRVKVTAPGETDLRAYYRKQYFTPGDFDDRVDSADLQ